MTITLKKCGIGKGARQATAAVVLVMALTLQSSFVLAQPAPPQAAPAPAVTPATPAPTPGEAAAASASQPSPTPVAAIDAPAPAVGQAVDPSAPAAPAAPGTAATPDTSAKLEQADLLAVADAKRHVRDGSVMPEALGTLFFTAWQHALLQEAKIGFNTRLPEGAVTGDSQQQQRPPGPREISLGGIAFANSSQWTVWLNGVRVTPTAIPEQVLDIKVSSSYIDLKWYDTNTNKIFPIRLRPQERFNLDMRLFLPGVGVPEDMTAGADAGAPPAGTPEGAM